MYVNYKLYLKCILSNNRFSFVDNEIMNNNNYFILLNNKVMYYLCLHFRFSSLFYSTQLVDIFSYEVLSASGSANTKGNTTSLVVYNFHLLNFNIKFFLFCKVPSKLYLSNIGSSQGVNGSLSSLSELFFAANWLEREVSELNGVFFSGKKDIRNLMLQYGDSTSPFQKLFPTIGLKEMYYNPIKDTIIQNPISVQI